jgi:antitoxin ParD1/3/4
MPTRNVVLTDHHEELIATLVGSGRYQNASEVLREGLRLIERREKDDAARLAALRRAAQEAVEDMDAGRYQTFERARGLRDYLAERAERRIRGREGA